MDRYLTGLQARRFEAGYHFPGWETRLYLDGRFTKGMADVIRKLGYNVVHLGPSDTSLPEWHHMASRMLVIDDPEVDVFMMRDLDSALSPRDAISTWAWMTSGASFLSMHDHFTHRDIMMGGMLVYPKIHPEVLHFDLAQAACKHDGKMCVPFPMVPHTGHKIEGHVGEVIGSLALMPRHVDVACKELVGGLENTPVFEEADLQAQWLGGAWPRMRGFCK
ncbi:hypothetical protein FNF27_02863 [Cafeteria roenbergensis]|uniref:Uncharacterized protein n=1 Tax=Cafeteria roenbergensis TaxID=33653 RepID=A0A5A8EGD1_CAFRO|nr:hypothetical protein FNF27_02863 [Cafeteria roenbergensis]